MKHLPSVRKTLAVFGAVLALGAAGGAAAAPAWITIGDKALAVMQKVAPKAQALASRQVPVTVPESRGSHKLVSATEGVHVVEIDDEMLPTLTLAVHAQLQRCGGYVRHASMAEALATLHRVRGTADFTANAAAPAPSYAIDNVAQVQALLPQLQASNILSTITQLSGFVNRRYNTSSGAAASDWLYNKWKSIDPGNVRGIRVTQFRHPNWGQKSVSFEILGSGTLGEAIVIGAHLDSIGSGAFETQVAPGADDDASGVATLTEMIRVLVASRYKPKRTLRFVAYAAEEVGLLGSREIVASYAGIRTRVAGVLQLDMTAFQGDPTDLWIFTDYTNAAQNQFLARLASTYLPQLTVGYDACGYGCSDHASWSNAGYAASFPFEASDARYNKALHTPNDTVATFGNQANHALKFAQLAMAYAVELASDDSR